MAESNPLNKPRSSSTIQVDNAGHMTADQSSTKHGISSFQQVVRNLATTTVNALGLSSGGNLASLGGNPTSVLGAATGSFNNGSSLSGTSNNFGNNNAMGDISGGNLPGGGGPNTSGPAGLNGTADKLYQMQVQMMQFNMQWTTQSNIQKTRWDTFKSTIQNFH